MDKNINNKNDIKSMAIALGLDPSKIVTKTNNKTTSINGNCEALEACRLEMQKVYIKHTKVYELETLTLGKNGAINRQIKTIRGFIDKHPTKANLDCIRELNIFAPYSETKVTPCYKANLKEVK